MEDFTKTTKVKINELESKQISTNSELAKICLELGNFMLSFLS